MNNIFDFFGLNETATKKDLDEVYFALKKKFQADRFEPGEVGEDAARNLGLIETYYAEAIELIARRSSTAESFDEFADIESLIKNGNLSLAQKKLDEVTQRSAEWHYIQSIVYYKQNWFLESKKQLEFAMSMDEKNPKYANSYEKLMKIMASKTVSPDDLKSREESTQGQQVHGGGVPTCTGNCCCDMCVANSCCNCMSSCMRC